MLDFFREQRGIRDETLQRFGVEVDGNKATFPYPEGIKTREHDGDKRKFFHTKGVVLSLFGTHDPEAKTAFLVEGETDTMRLWQELNAEAEAPITVMGLPGVEAWKPEFADQFAPYENVFVVLDNDEDYKVSARVDNCWYMIRKGLGPAKANRVRLPVGVNDLCEFFDAYTVDGLRALVESEEGTRHYQSLDLKRDPGPINWLVSDLLAKGDLALLIGEPGVGKSWVSMALAVAVAEGLPTFMGRPLAENNHRVLYVDEENPEGLVLRRLRKLGLTDVGADNVRFLHRQGIRLDRKPELLLDEVLDWSPTLIVLDSLTRMHTRDENNAGEVATLFNDGINPLARESGATTLLLHHITKTDSSSSFARARGSGDISASVDSALDIRATDLVGGFAVNLYKSRWIEEGQYIKAHRVDDGPYTRIVADENRQVF